MKIKRRREFIVLIIVRRDKSCRSDSDRELPLRGNRRLAVGALQASHATGRVSGSITRIVALWFPDAANDEGEDVITEDMVMRTSLDDDG